MVEGILDDLLEEQGIEAGRVVWLHPHKRVHSCFAEVTHLGRFVVPDRPFEERPRGALRDDLVVHRTDR